MGQKILVGLQGNPCFEWSRIRIRGFYIYVNAYVGHIDNHGVAGDCDYDDDVLDDGDVVFVDNNDDDVLDGLPAHSHHDNIPPWWGNVSNDKGGNVSVSNSHHT